MDDQHPAQSKLDPRGLQVVTGPSAPVTRAANAVTHGLTAKRLLPEILGPDLLDRLRQQFVAEWEPKSPTQAHLVEELARHAAALERCSQIEEAALRSSAAGLVQLWKATDGSDACDQALAATMGGDVPDRLTRYRRAHEKAFQDALHQLREIRSPQGQPSMSLANTVNAPLFEDDICQAYLRRRWEAGESRCECGSSDGSWLARRDVWHCRGCRAQSSVRTGTVMAQSLLPLGVWFAAIAMLIGDPNATTQQLADATGIQRSKTIRTLAERILDAIVAPDADVLLAGLDNDVLKDLVQAPR